MSRSSQIAVMVLCVAGVAAAAELTSRTVAAFDAYVDKARRTFLSQDFARLAAPADGVVDARPGADDGISELPGGLRHHWSGTTFAKGVTLRAAMAVSTGFQDYPHVYKNVTSARVVSRDGDRYHVRLRIQESEGGLHAVLDVRSTVEYSYPTEHSAIALSTSDEIREVKNAGRSDESLLPAGRDSGYLWRGATFTYFREDPNGLFVDTENLALSRGFPPLLGWIIEPIARRVGRRSIVTTLLELTTAARARR